MNGNAFFSIVDDAWLGGLLGRPVRAVNLGDFPAESMEEVKARLDAALGGGPLFAYAKVDARELRRAHLLEQAGFRLIDTSVRLERRGQGNARPAPEIAVRPALQSDAPAVEDLAGRCFSFSRFHLDERLPDGAADRIKAAWAGNFFAGKRGDMMIVAEERSKVVGFLQILLPADGALVIDLIGVDAGFRGRGAGRAMIEEGCRIAGRGLARVGTQIANRDALAFYQRLGFAAVSAEYVFHYHS